MNILKWLFKFSLNSVLFFYRWLDRQNKIVKAIFLIPLLPLIILSWPLGGLIILLEKIFDPRKSEREAAAMRSYWDES